MSVTFIQEDDLDSVNAKTELSLRSFRKMI